MIHNKLKQRPGRSCNRTSLVGRVPKCCLFPGGNMIALLLAAMPFGVGAIAQTPSPIQVSKTTSFYPIIGPVMLAGSDARSRDFENNVLPIVNGVIRAQLRSHRIFTSPGGYRLDPKHLAVAEHPQRPMRVYFIDEGTAISNSLGISVERFSTESRKINKRLIFPNASKPELTPRFELFSALGPRSQIAPLRPGDFVDIPNIQIGDMLNFFLIVNGANGGMVHLWGDPEWNPMKAVQMVAFQVPGHPNFMIISFEDIPANWPWQDRDFEDVIFVVDHGYNYDSTKIPH